MKKAVLVVLIVVICAALAGIGMYAPAAEKTAGKPGAETSSQQKPAAPAKAEQAGDIAAKVNGQAIPMADYKMEMERFDRQVAMMGRPAEDKQVAQAKQQIIQNLIGREVLKQEAARIGIKADPAEVEAQFQGLKGKMGSPEEFAKAMEQMGLSEKVLKEQFAADMVMSKLIDQEVASKVSVGPDEAKEFFDKNAEMFKTPEMIRASHILVKVDKGASPEDKAKAMEKIKGIEKKIKDGADFADTAKEVSDCPSKDRGGDLDFFGRGNMVPPFEQAAFALKPNEMSGIVETEFGYHLIKVTDHKDAGSMSFEEIKPRIEQYLKSDKVSQQLAQYVEKLKSAAKIEVFVQ